MTGYQGGQLANEGYYLKCSTLEFETVARGGAILSGDSQIRYIKMPLPVVMMVGPFAGLAFIIFLPLTGIIGISGFLVYKVGQWMQIFRRKTLHLVAIGWKSITARFTRQGSTPGRRGTS